jgi:hypothetical protein
MVLSKILTFPVKTYILWHPNLRGDKIIVERNWVQQLFWPNYYATQKEVSKFERQTLQFQNETMLISKTETPDTSIWHAKTNN